MKSITRGEIDIEIDMVKSVSRGEIDIEIDIVKSVSQGEIDIYYAGGLILAPYGQPLLGKLRAPY